MKQEEDFDDVKKLFKRIYEIYLEVRHADSSECAKKLSQHIGQFVF